MDLCNILSGVSDESETREENRYSESAGLKILIKLIQPFKG